MKKKSGTLATILKRISPGTLLLLAVTLAANGFAWFVYTTKVEGGITAHVRAWDIQFVVGNTPLTQEVDFDVNDVYPGMETFTDSIVATNKGEEPAVFSYEIVSATILGTTYVVDENLTSEELLYNLEHNYPFVISFTTSSEAISANGGESAFLFNFSWPYESGDDILDTSWGNMAYDYYQASPLGTAISLKIKLTAVQTGGTE